VSCSEYDQTHRLGMTSDELQALHAALTEVIAAAVTASKAEGAEDVRLSGERCNWRCE
jgi:hypothetical protein